MAQNSHGQRHDRTALILYGSETGNSQDVAEELGRIAEKLHFVTRVCEMDLVEIVGHRPRSFQSWVKSMRSCIQSIESSPTI
jgi:sulfite reductase alpha subunit-like flavoprotein